MTTPQVDQVIQGYLSLREQKEAMAKRHKEEIAPLTAKLEQLESWLQAKLNQLGLSNFKAEGIGIAFLETKTECKVADWDATIEWIKATGAFEMLEKRVAKSVVDDYITQHNAVPPGISITQEIRTRVRKG